MKRRRSFWKWLYLWSRAGAIADAHKKRIIRENLATWNRYNSKFIKKCEREEERALDRKLNRTSHLGYNPLDGSGWQYHNSSSKYGSDCGDGTGYN